MIHQISVEILDGILASCEHALEKISQLQKLLIFQTRLNSHSHINDTSEEKPIDHDVPLSSTQGDQKPSSSLEVINKSQEELNVDYLRVEFDEMHQEYLSSPAVFLITKKRSRASKLKKQRVFNIDSMVKKIKAKFLKFLYNQLRKQIQELTPLKLNKFNQIEEVRNIDIHHNQKIVNMTIENYLVGSGIFKDLDSVRQKEVINKIAFRRTKVKHFYQNNFLKSSEFKEWINDPAMVKLMSKGRKKLKPLYENKNCIKYKFYSKNLFKNSRVYEKYRKDLFRASHDYIFYFHNNSYFTSMTSKTN